MAGPPPPVRPLVRGALRGLSLLPPALQQRIGGEPAVLDGQRLAPEASMRLRLEEAVVGPGFETLPVPEARRSLDDAAALARPPRARLREVRDLAVDGGEGPRPARLYVPNDAAEPGGLLVALHGGGWVLGGLGTHDRAWRVLARDSGVRVLAVDYRLAPEHPFPAGLEDALAAFRWAVANAGRLGADPSRVGIGGDSAGGNLSAVVARLAAGDQAPPAMQLLIYPVCDSTRKSRSYELFGEGFSLTEAQMDWYSGHYLPDPAEAADPRVSPLLAGDLSGLAPAHVAVAGFDPLRDEGIAYAERLREAGNEVELSVERGLDHAFLNMTWISRTAATAVRGIADAVRKRLGA
ncbi:MAG: alpha/beta hydrolase [Solirubrobacterales bacterium]